MLVRSKKAQSILEYALLIAVVVAAILIMQVFVKRGFQGQLKDSSDRMGEQFSVSGSTSKQHTNSTGQNVTDETATDYNFSDRAGGGNMAIDTPRLRGDVSGEGVLEKGAYSASARDSGTQSVNTSSATDSASEENFKMNFTGPTNGGDSPDSRFDMN
jgi:hypothetical protein